MSPCVVLELYATEIQMYSELKDSKKMKVCKFLACAMTAAGWT